MKKFVGAEVLLQVIRVNPEAGKLVVGAGQGFYLQRQRGGIFVVPKNGGDGSVYEIDVIELVDQSLLIAGSA
jgi:hypothetical protein